MRSKPIHKHLTSGARECFQTSHMFFDPTFLFYSAQKNKKQTCGTNLHALKALIIFDRRTCNSNWFQYLITLLYYKNHVQIVKDDAR